MKFDVISSFIRRNFLLISVGVASVILLLFLSETFGSAKTESTVSDNSSLEDRIEDFLSSLQGVGECDVMIFSEQSKVSSFSSAVTENISGIAVICSGGGNSSVKSVITEVLTRLFGLSGSRISINEKG